MWSRDVTLQNKKLYLQFHKVHNYQTWQSGDLL